MVLWAAHTGPCVNTLKCLSNLTPGAKRTSPVQPPTEAGDGRVIGVFGISGKRVLAASCLPRSVANFEFAFFLLG